MATQEIFCASEDVVAREVGGEMVLLDLASGLYFGLDPVGTVVWQHLSDHGATLAQIADVIEAEFDAPRDRIEADLVALIAQLSEKKLIAPVAV
jgi:hypothetical protein